MKNFITSNDTGLAASIVAASGFPVEAIKKREGGRVFFSFRESEQVQQIINRFWAKTLQVDAQTLLLEFKRSSIE